MTGRAIPLLLAVVVQAGCVSRGQVQIWQVQLMPRDSGKIYTGMGEGDGSGGDRVTITIEGETYTGPAVRTSANESFGFVQTYGSHGLSTFGTAQSVGGPVYVKAILSSVNNHGLRCDLTGDGRGHLGGICVDDKAGVYDIVASLTDIRSL
jgi:hypothetical protein